MKNYEFKAMYMNRQCDVVMTCVSGHITGIDFDRAYKSWRGCDPAMLFDAPIVKGASEVRL